MLHPIAVMLHKLSMLLFILQSTSAFSESHVPYEPHLSASSSCFTRKMVDQDQKMRLTFSLSIPRVVADSAALHLQNIADPQSADFAKHWTSREVDSLFASDPHRVRDVTRWLEESKDLIGNLVLVLDVDHLMFDIACGKAEKLLRTKFNECLCGSKNYVCSSTYHLPRNISKHVDLVTAEFRIGERGLASHLKNRMPAPPRDGARNSEPKNIRRQVDCFKYTTPECLRLLYGIPSSSTPSHPDNSVGVYASDWLTWLGEDLDQFFGDFQPNLISHRPVILPINGGFRDPTLKSFPFNMEPNLDFGFSMALVDPLPVIDIQVGDKFLRGNLNTMLAGFDKHYCKTALDPAIDPAYPDSKNPGGYNALDCGNRKPPLVISISWAQPEAELPPRYSRRQCLEFLKLGLQGVTVLAASGDFGPASTQGTCINPESGSLNTTTGEFSPNFPASCPWVTAVGGSQVNAMNQTWKPGAKFPREAAFMWESDKSKVVASSGGGFSRVFKSPSYQTKSVESYLNNDGEHARHLMNLSSAGYFTPGGRGYPDLAAAATGYLVYVVGQRHQIYGTSASTPVVASMIAKVNDARLHAGKRPVGFINPVLYRHSREFMRDVDEGHNTGCGVLKAYPAASGWDAVSGLGTLDFKKLLDFYLRLP